MATTVSSPRFNRPEPDKVIAGGRQPLRSSEFRVDGEVVPGDAVLRALEQILESNVFRLSARLSNFLRFTVERTLEGSGKDLKEYRIATEIYGRKADFDPSQDTIVRSEARRLRRKLEEYYESEGKDDDVVIFFRRGSYMPGTRWRTALPETILPAPVTALNSLWACQDGVEVVVKPLLSHRDDHLASALAFGVSDEILYRLMRVSGIRVVSHSLMEQNRATDGNAAFQITIDGTVRTVNGRLCVTARVVTIDGLVLWSQRFDGPSEASTRTDFPELVAASIVSRISPKEAMARGYATHNSYLFYSEALAAEALLETGSISSITAALQRFEALTAKAPRYARAHSGIAQCCVALSERGVNRWQDFNAKAKKACLAAISADPKDIHAHSAMGCLLTQAWKWKEGEDSFHTALCSGEHHIAHRQFSHFLLAQKRFDEAWKHLQLADEADPFSSQQKFSKARFLYYSCRHREADQYHRWLAQSGTLTFELRVLQALSETQQGDLAKTRMMSAKWIHEAAEMGGPLRVALAAEVLASCDETDAARSLIMNAGLLERTATISCFRKAILALALKDHSEGLRFLTESWRHAEPELIWVLVDPRFGAIHAEEEYLAIVTAVFDGKNAYGKDIQTIRRMRPV